MRKVIIIFLTMILLVGCRKADSQEIILSDEGMNRELTLDATSGSSLEELASADSCDQNEEPALGTDTSCAVFVCGAVVDPGVYYLDHGSRIIDAVEAAGGFAENADKDYVNLAYPIQDGLKLQIPTRDEIEKADTADSSSVPDYDYNKESMQTSGGADKGASFININTATAEELMTLPGIGKGIAGKIIDYRTENGKFTAIEDIMKVSGIKDKLFSKIKDHITV